MIYRACASDIQQDDAAATESHKKQEYMVQSDYIFWVVLCEKNQWV